MSHWYILKDGIPQRYTQLTKAGTERKKILKAQAYKDGAVMGVTDIIGNVGGGEGVKIWYGNHALRVGLEMGQSPMPANEDEKAVWKAMKDDLKARTTREADEGSAIHAAIEERLNAGAVSENEIHRTAQDEAERWLKEHGILPPYRSEHCFVHHEQGLHFGGTADLVSPEWIVDFKTVEDKGWGFRDPYAKEAAQMAAYRVGFGYPEAKCANVYFDRKTGGIVSEKIWKESQVEKGWELFQLAYRAGELIERLEG